MLFEKKRVLSDRGDVDAVEIQWWQSSGRDAIANELTLIVELPEGRRYVVISDDGQPDNTLFEKIEQGYKPEGMLFVLGRLSRVKGANPSRSRLVGVWWQGRIISCREEGIPA